MPIFHILNLERLLLRAFTNLGLGKNTMYVV